MIKLQVIGNLGKDCIVKEVNGKNVINFSVAHTERYKDAQGNQKERTTWVECAYWTDRTAIAPYLTKGTTVYAEGSPEADAYMNKDNQASATLRMRVQNIQLLGGRNNDNQGASAANTNSYAGSNTPSAQRPAATAPVASMPEAADDLPF
ncbi:MAG: single-stranded DNA-binding protein [Chitinophagaceae bacterium]|nr:single-stranded DNA-binding protein [Chitinophagaceae bacterium]